MIVEQSKHVILIMLSFKNVVFYLSLITKLVLLRKFGNIVYDIARKYEGLLNVVDLRKCEKLHLKVKKSGIRHKLFIEL